MSVVRATGGAVAVVAAALALPLSAAPASSAPSVPGALPRPTALAGATYTPPAPEDFSALTWSQAFARLHAKLVAEYAFTGWKGIDFPVLRRTYAPRIAAAQLRHDRAAYLLALREYAGRLRDGHVGVTDVPEVVEARAGGGFGLVLDRLDDGTVAVTWLAPGGPAARAGLVVGARVTAWNGKGIARALAGTSTVLGPSQATTARHRSEQLRWLVRAPVGERRAVTFVRPGRAPVTRFLRAVDDDLLTLTRTDDRSVIGKGQIPRRLVTHRVLPGGVGYLRVAAEIDLPASLPGDHTPTMTLFRAAVRELTAAKVVGIVLDIRGNGGGSDQMVADMMASFAPTRRFYEYQNYRVSGTDRFETWIGADDGTFGHRGEGVWVVPAAPRYTGPVVALVDNGCISSCEGLAMQTARLPRGLVVGFTGTNGSFGMAGAGALLPEGLVVRWPFGRSLDRTGVVQIDSRGGVGGVAPGLRVPSTLALRTAYRSGVDVVLREGMAAVHALARGAAPR